MQCSCEHNPNFPSHMADRIQDQQAIGNQNNQGNSVDPLTKNEFDRMMDAPTEASSAGQSDASGNGGQTMQELLMQLLPMILQLILSLGENGTSTSGDGSTDGNTLTDNAQNSDQSSASLNPTQYA